ncbi:hypothetical protein Sjap_024517 [Stephania japonica]|uniref:Mediator of RNA polymerase II transcription subunit 20 n=1 Tax=Stephania japonica TaxID=461633 RepID=A0AAP0EFP7_9MAGN
MGISLQEQPNKFYFIIRSQQIVLEADSMLQMIMEKSQSYRSRALVSFEEQPNKFYFIIRSQQIVLEADSMLQMIMEKLQSYRSRALEIINDRV